MTTTTHRISKAERDFSATIRNWRTLGLEITEDEKHDRFFGHSKTASTSVRSGNTTLFCSVQLRIPSDDPIRIRRRTTLKHNCLLFHGIDGKKVSAWTANHYLRVLCDETANAA